MQFCRRPLGRRTGSKWPKTDHFWVVFRQNKRHDIRYFHSAYASKSGWSLDDWTSIDSVITDPVNPNLAAFNPVPGAFFNQDLSEFLPN